MVNIIYSPLFENRQLGSSEFTFHTCIASMLRFTALNATVSQ
jgi:hypothetical protein